MKLHWEASLQSVTKETVRQQKVCLFQTHEEKNEHPLKWQECQRRNRWRVIINLVCLFLLEQNNGQTSIRPESSAVESSSSHKEEDRDKHFTQIRGDHRTRDITRDMKEMAGEKRRMMTTVIILCFLVFFHHHCYWINGITKRSKSTEKDTVKKSHIMFVFDAITRLTSAKQEVALKR